MANGRARPNILLIQSSSCLVIQVFPMQRDCGTPFRYVFVEALAEQALRAVQRMLFQYRGLDGWINEAEVLTGRAITVSSDFFPLCQ